MEKKNAVMLADTRIALIGTLLMQLQNGENKDLFSEAIIYFDAEISEKDRQVLLSIMPCRFIKYAPPLPRALFKSESFKRFSILSFTRYEIFNFLSEFDNVVWLDTDILLQKSLKPLLNEAEEHGFAILCEDPVNKSAENPDYMYTNFSEHIPDYDMYSYLYCTGVIAANHKLNMKDDYASWCYEKTIELADVLVLPDQGVINALIQKFNFPVTSLNCNIFGCFPSYQRNCEDSLIIHSWGPNKFWSDWYLRLCYPNWEAYYTKWVNIGGSALNFENSPAISVIIPVYKPQMHLLKECLDSLIIQIQNDNYRYSNFEVIIVSEPFNQQEIQQLVSSYNDPRFTVVFAEKRLGIAACLNWGIRLSKGKYIARIDDDDIADKWRLFKQAEYLDTHPEVNLCVTNFNYFEDMNEQRFQFEGELSKAWSVLTCPFDHPTIMFRKDFFLENNLFYDESRGYVEDWELWNRAFDKGMVVGCVPEVLFYHRWHTGSAGQTNSTGEMMDQMVKKNFEKLHIDVTDEMLPFIGPWRGRVAPEVLEKLEDLFKQALVNNLELKLYDQASLSHVFELRLEEARTGIVPKEIWSPVELQEATQQIQDSVVVQEIISKKKPFKNFVKRVLKPFYRAIKWRYEDRIVHIEQVVADSQIGIGNLPVEIRNILKDNQTDVSIFEKYMTELEDKTRNTINGVTEDVKRQLDAFSAQINERFSHIVNQQELLLTEMKRNNVSVNFWLDYKRLNSFLRKKIFLIGTPDHQNVGDAAIALGTYAFIKQYFPDYEVVEVTGYKLDEHYQIMQSILAADDYIFLQGGGNLGDMYLLEENIRRKIIADFPNNPIIIMPQTIYFENEIANEQLAISEKIYNTHKKLKLFCRGEQSLAFAKKHFIYSSPASAIDMALMIKREYNVNRNGILLCLRDLTDESGLSKALYDQIEQIVSRIDPGFLKTNNLYKDFISPEMRQQVVTDELEKFAAHKVIVTDRLHGMIFAIITNTPCVVMNAYTQKIREFANFFNDSNAVFFIDKEIDLLEGAVKQAFNVGKTIYPIMECRPFDAIFNAIIENGRQ